MAGQRKLLSEIDRTLKKVNEGVEVFNSIWDKVYSAAGQSQKEKHEADLKKEIKKLQRFRDQIKTWIGSSDVKDKRPLLDARKLIENKMEEFKVCEKETKTKAYSKEGLLQAERLDPHEQAKQQTISWIQESISQFNDQIETMDCDVERLRGAKGKKNKSEIENLELLLARHKWHVLKLEQIARLLDNDAIDPSSVDALKDEIDYYLEANQEPDFMETYGEDDIYEVLDLDSLSSIQISLDTAGDGGDDSDEDGGPPATPQPTAPTTPARASAKNPSSTASSSASKKAVATPIAGIGRPGAVKAVDLKTTSAAPSSTPVRPPANHNLQNPQRQNAQDQNMPNHHPPLPSSSSSQNHHQKDSSEDSRSSHQHHHVDSSNTSSSSSSSHPTPHNRSTLSSSSDQPVHQLNHHPPHSTRMGPPSIPKPSQSSQLSSQPLQSKPISGGSSYEEAARKSSSLNGQQTPPSISNAAKSSPPSSGTSSSSSSHANPTTTSMRMNPMTPPPSSSISSSSSSSSSSSVSRNSAQQLQQLSDDRRALLALIDESFKLMPDAVDSEKGSRYVPRNMYPTPMSFPSTPAPLFESATIFEKFDLDTLFFIFYYQQGTYQQYLAARELKRQAWGYHKKYKTWFKRHEEPQMTGEDFEQGTFVYFDYETGWCQRIKTEFTFEYSYLEDELLV
jgi:CCR4-NOT transcription complex subunit 3